VKKRSSRKCRELIPWRLGGLPLQGRGRRGERAMCDLLIGSVQPLRENAKRELIGGESRGGAGGTENSSLALVEQKKGGHGRFGSEKGIERKN